MPHATPPKPHRIYARAMRNDSTRAENMLWQQIRNRQMDGAKFRRQVPLKGHILDFVAFEERLIIEVDGSQHAEIARDAARDALFRADGFRVMRFWNEEIETGLDFVCRSILAVLRDRGSEWADGASPLTNCGQMRRTAEHLGALGEG